MSLMERVSSGSTQSETVPEVAPAPAQFSYFPGERSPILRQIAKTYYLAQMGRQLNTPTPRDKPEYRSGMSAAYKVLLVGNGPTHGWGVVTHGLALTGQLPQHLSRRTSYGVDLDYVGEELLNASTMLGFLDDRDIAAYDLIVVVLSVNDAVRLTPVNEWETQINESLDYLREQRRPGVKMMVVGVQSVDTTAGYHNFMGTLGQRHADRLNARMIEMVKASGDSFMPLSAPNIIPGIGGRLSDTYTQWADEISGNLVRLLPHTPPTSTQLEEDTWDRPQLERVMGFDGVDRSEKLHEILGRAKRSLLAPIAYISVVDHGNQYMPTSTGSMAAKLPIDLSYCKYTVQTDEPVIVENAMKDERFAGNGYVDSVNLPFYAGQSLTGEDGEVIGTFCVMGPLPRGAKHFPLEKFKAFAVEAQDALRAIEAEKS